MRLNFDDLPVGKFYLVLVGKSGKNAKVTVAFRKDGARDFVDWYKNPGEILPREKVLARRNFARYYDDESYDIQSDKEKGARIVLLTNNPIRKFRKDVIAN